MKQIKFFQLAFSFLLMLLIAGVMQSCHTHSPIVTDGYEGSYTIIDDAYGTETVVAVSGDKRIMISNSLPNHETGSFPNAGNPNTISAQQVRYEFPLNPKYLGVAKPVKETGVALNGVKFDPGTAERVDCESGEVFRIEAIQNYADLGLDMNHAHVQPTGHYHYHGESENLVRAFDEGDGDIVHIGYALDGFQIVRSKSNAYRSSYKLSDTPRVGTDCKYVNPKQSSPFLIQGSMPDGTLTSDWEYQEGIGNLDECNGAFVDGTYMYFVTEEYPYVGRCLMGEFTESRRRGPRPPRGMHPPRRNRM